MRGKSCQRGKLECAEELAGKGVLRARDWRRYDNSFVRGRDLDHDYCD